MQCSLINVFMPSFSLNNAHHELISLFHTILSKFLSVFSKYFVNKKLENKKVTHLQNKNQVTVYYICAMKENNNEPTPPPLF